MADEGKPYATLEGYETYFGSVSGESEQARIGALLGKASARLAELVAENDVDEQGKADALEEVCCNMVNRRIRAASSTPLSSVTHQANGFSVTESYRASTRLGWQLYPEDYDALGIAVGGVACVSPWRAS